MGVSRVNLWYIKMATGKILDLMYGTTQYSCIKTVKLAFRDLTQNVPTPMSLLPLIVPLHA